MAVDAVLAEWNDATPFCNGRSPAGGKGCRLESIVCTADYPVSAADRAKGVSRIIGVELKVLAWEGDGRDARWVDRNAHGAFILVNGAWQKNGGWARTVLDGLPSGSEFELGRCEKF